MLMIIQTPEGGEFMADAVVGLSPREAQPPGDQYVPDDFVGEVDGTLVMLSSGHTIETAETVERIRAQIVECFNKAAQQ
jgi:hypothetical protein